MRAKGRKTWVLHEYSWQFGRHVTHGIYKEQTAHFPLTSLGSCTTTGSHCPREFQIKQRKINQGKETQTHTEKRGGMFLPSPAEFWKGPEQELCV